LTTSESPEPRDVTLDELIALSDEIAALARAGVPLESGLAELGGDMPGRLGQWATLLAARASRGEPLLKVLADQSLRLPPVYRAVIEAGLRTHRLPAALESLAGAVRRLAETRRSIVAASLYPLLVLMLACGLLAFFSRHVAPTLAWTFRSLGGPGHAVYGVLISWGQWAGVWGTLLPAAILVLAVAWWRQSRRAAVVEPRASALLLGWLPWVRQTLQFSQAAAFTEVLALLVENQVPLPTGLVLAAEACGDPRLAAAAKQLAEELERGQSPGDNARVAPAMPVPSQSRSHARAFWFFKSTGRASGTLGRASGTRPAAEFPPLLAWLMAAGHRQGALLPALKHAAATYRRRAQRQAELAQVFLPVLLTVVLAGGATAVYALTLFVPYVSLLKALARG
jgi:general secretion pathway protein F